LRAPATKLKADISLSCEASKILSGALVPMPDGCPKNARRRASNYVAIGPGVSSRRSISQEPSGEEIICAVSRAAKLTDLMVARLLAEAWMIRSAKNVDLDELRDPPRWLNA
jgi:hypothetical protein